MLYYNHSKGDDPNKKERGIKNDKQENDWKIF